MFCDAVKMKISIVVLTIFASVILTSSVPTYKTQRLEGNGVGVLPQSFGYAQVKRGAHAFWWFFPTTQAEPTSRPTILWLDGLLGQPPSFLANFKMFGPYDENLNRRDNSWVEDYNLLFVDAPVGTGFSYFNYSTQIPRSTEDYAEDLFDTLQSFYSLHEEYRNSPLYVFGQGHGAKQAVALATRVNEDINANININGIVLGGAIISPALVLTKLGFYLEELGYIDVNGRSYIESLASDTNRLVNEGNYDAAFTNFFNLRESVNEGAGAAAVNLENIVEKVTRDSIKDNINEVQTKIRSGFDINTFMNENIAPSLGINGMAYNSLRDITLNFGRSPFMVSDVEKVENILENSNINVYIYNGNLDGTSNTPGQLEWVNNLRWRGHNAFRSSPRRTIVVNRQLEGYVRATDRLHFYWVNVAGRSVPLDSPVAMREVLRRIAGY